jgi:CubicO group peptidase (beta-lactamase class C family)
MPSANERRKPSTVMSIANRVSFPSLGLILLLLITTARPARAEVTPSTADIQSLLNTAKKQNHVKALIVQVRGGGHTFYLHAFGESMTGVPATTDMHFRNGAMAFTYIATMLLELADQQPDKVRLNDKLSRFLPELRDSDQVTLKELLNMTSGYQDYVAQPDVIKAITLDPFRQFTSEELIQFGLEQTPWFTPGKNWAYSHTNYVILGRVLEKITGMPLNDAMHKYIFRPMGLKQTEGFSTPQVPEPVLHAYSSEQREELHVPPSIPFYEDATYWNPSWTTAEGAIQTTDIDDMTRSMEIIGEGLLLSPASYLEQVGPNLVGLGGPQKGCPCHNQTHDFNYGLGVVNLGPWITQTKSFAGSGATTGYLPYAKLTITVVTTYSPEAFDDTGAAPNASLPIFADLAHLLAPHTLPPLP